MGSAKRLRPLNELCGEWWESEGWCVSAGCEGWRGKGRGCVCV